MLRSFRSIFAAAIVAAALLIPSATAQIAKGLIAGTAKDSGGSALPGAVVKLNPIGKSTTTDELGQFTFTDVPAGPCTVTISYVGLTTFTKDVTVKGGETARIEAALAVAVHTDSITVTEDRPRGEAEDINRERSADNILDVQSADVIMSLPNANIADALGRMPGVSLERDEGEGKYVQIRGTEPRLNNVTIDGVSVPSPEPGVREIKLDALAADLVGSIEINKTLQANMDGDGIGGSVNLKTKTAADTPMVTLYGLGGYTPIIGGRGVNQWGGTVSDRFGKEKRLGVVLGGTYDFNGRGINDIEPTPTVPTGGGSALPSPHYDSMDIRDYEYYRTRYGFSGSTDYRLDNGSSIYLRGFYSTFQDYGQKWVYTLNDGDNPSASIDYRRPDYAVGNLVVGGHHNLPASWFNWDASVSRSRMQASGGQGKAKFKYDGGAANCYDDPSITTDMYRPQWTPSCFTAGAGDIEDINNYKLNYLDPPSIGQSAQLNLQASASYAKIYHAGSHYGSFEFGFKIRNGHKYDDSYAPEYDANGTIPIAQFAGNFSDSSYYDNSYPFPNMNADYAKMRTFVFANPNLFTLAAGTGPGPNAGNFDLVERVTAGYLMNSIDLAPRIRLVTGVRFEATHLGTTAFNSNDNLLDYTTTGDYVDVLPSASLRFSTTKDSSFRLVYSRALSRPDPQDIAQAVGPVDNTVTPATVSLGNANLKAEHADNLDLLFEQYLKPLGLFQVGYFYKYLTDPIIGTLTTPTTGEWAGYLVSEPGNAGSAWISGVEVAYQQHLGFLPGHLAGFGIAANYTYTTSQASGIQGRSDSPALQRQAPHTWNISPTFDRGRLSMRVGMTYNSSMIYAYQYLNLNSDGSAMAAADLPQGLQGGPGGDNYLYGHFQIDAQGTLRLAKGFQLIVYGLNLSNEVFGFYNGSPQYVVQREYYHPTYAAGMRWTSVKEKW
ncbi:MAG: TonB-dependent receptor [Bryobacteraceae bacterium]